jgi:membrane fusion protein, adhesin transport system
MLNLSENTIRNQVDTTHLTAYGRLQLGTYHWNIRRLLLILAGLLLLFMFLPWTQNIQADGRVTTLRPEHRPQTIHATIAGRIEKWYVAEGQSVRQGDTIVFLSEVKTDYFDPALVQRTDEQVSAKSQAIGAYQQKAGALDDQIAAMQAELRNKIEQIRNKIKQGELKVVSDQADLERANVDKQVAQRQLDGTKNLYDKGLKSLTELEEKRLKMQETTAKVVSANNKLDISRNELENSRVELTLTQNEYANKIAKAQSDKFSTLSDQFDAEAQVGKLRVDRENYARRAQFYYITAPQDGYVVQAIRPGLGEIIKEGDPVVSILPRDYSVAVEMFVKPNDLPLVSLGNEVRFLFDGWPAFFFSGWPNQSFGTFSGRVAAIDRNISSNGKFRILVSPNPAEEAWPTQLQVGGGARGIALLNDVPVWYEFWRTLNGFPPDFYKSLPPAPGDAAKDKAKDTKTIVPETPKKPDMPLKDAK